MPAVPFNDGRSTPMFNADVQRRRSTPRREVSRLYSVLGYS
jgi:hypothetical protein